MSYSYPRDAAPDGSAGLAWVSMPYRAVGAFRALLLALFAGTLNFQGARGELPHSARTVAMVSFIIVSATCFAYVYRALGGDDIVEKLIRHADLTSWGMLILIMAIVSALGFILDWIEITLIVLGVLADDRQPVARWVLEASMQQPLDWVGLFKRYVGDRFEVAYH